MGKKKVMFVSAVALFGLVFSLAGCQKDKAAASSRQPDSAVETFEKNLGNERHYQPAYFANPNNQYRILPVNNDSPLTPGGASISTFENYMQQGYGGAVTNVAWGDGYLTNENAWNNLVEAVSYGIDKLGMRVMIYDEDDYPSGGARTQTLQATPAGEKWDAEGLVQEGMELHKGTAVTIPSLHGHTLIHAYIYGGSSLGSIDPTTGTDIVSGLHESYTPSEDGYLSLLYQKSFYEGTHFQNNLMESRRYIDLLQKKPVQEFLHNTYEKYYEKLGRYFGKGIEATFSDEPSMPGFYFSPTSASVIDAVDSEVPFLPAVDWSHTLRETFQARYGYDMDPYLPYLFEPSNAYPKIRRFRWDYYQLLGELVSSNFFQTIRDWDQQHGLLSSGHMLCEEDIAAHAMLAGNYLQNYHQMGIPGMDSTYGQAAKNLKIGSVVAKQVTSVVDFDGKHSAFCEIGQDAADGAGASVYDNMAATAVLQSFGINYLVSYYRFATDEENALLANTAARINYLLAGNVSDKSVGVYYPIESIYADETPYNSKGQRIYTGSWGWNPYVTVVNDNYQNLVQSLVKEQVDYHIFDANDLSQCEVKDGALVSPNGERFTSFVLPTSTALDLAAAQKLLAAAESGVKILLQNPANWLAHDETKQSELDATRSALLAKATAVNGDYQVAAASLLKLDPAAQKTRLTSADGDIVARKQSNGASVLYYLVNTSNKKKNLTLETPEVGTEYLKWDPVTGKVGGMAVRTENGKSYLPVNLEAYGIGIYTIGEGK